MAQCEICGESARDGQALCISCRRRTKCSSCSGAVSSGESICQSCQAKKNKSVESGLPSEAGPGKADDTSLVAPKLATKYQSNWATKSKQWSALNEPTETVDGQILKELRQQNTYLKVIMKSVGKIFIFLLLAWIAILVWGINLIFFM